MIAGAASAPPWRFTVSGHPPGPNDRLHPLARYRLCRPFHDGIAWQACAVGLSQPLQRAHVTVTLIYCRRPLRDHDNVVASLKACIDGLVAGGMLVSDAPDHISLDVRQEVGDWRGVLVEVTPAPATRER